MKNNTKLNLAIAGMYISSSLLNQSFNNICAILDVRACRKMYSELKSIEEGPAHIITRDEVLKSQALSNRLTLLENEMPRIKIDYPLNWVPLSCFVLKGRDYLLPPRQPNTS